MGTVTAAPLTLRSMQDAALVILQVRRRAAARRLAKLVQTGAVLADDYRALTECYGDDHIIEAALTLALRARELSGALSPSTLTVRGIVGFHERSRRWSARAGGVASAAEEFSCAADAAQWLDIAVAGHRSEIAPGEPYYLQIGIVEYESPECRSSLPHSDAGWCDVCLSVEEAALADMELHRGVLNEVAVDGSMMGTRAVPR